MEYPYYPNPQSQQFSLYNLQGAPTLGQNDDDNHRNPQTDDIQDTLASLGIQSYQSFDPSFRFQNPTAAFGHPPHSPPESFSKHSASGSDIFGQPTEPTSLDGELGFGRSSSEEKESMTPAQSKRKAQNRAAQRAFRERKERHVRELEEKVNSLEQASSNLVADNERLKRELARFTTENEILRATSGSSDRTHHNSDEPTTTGPLTYTPTDFYSELVPKGEPARLHRVSTCAQTGEKLLGAGATWDLIQGHELFKRGLVDIRDVSERLKNITQCDGQGPAFPETEVLKAIEESAAAHDDDLL
ncbi:bZIP transcription factor (Fcr3) [Aspergillus bombycis]|uniref:BZIP transcription factor (Fcr3) n=1 Tax=Aspergillus bombycis TaxID=109264 RepID=A0A1F7ZK72_9EURO|nr:bZIP transcription factor (Fcr3) [Aspergillus bombycis]OGM39841.1 bZIP transcription factor (Fcr3) [Aspergillus bombycis]